MKKIIVCLILFLLIVPGMAWGQYSNAPRGSGGSGSTLPADAPGYLKNDGSGGYSWDTPAGTGDVTKVGTPTEHQQAVWTGDGTIKGVTVTGSKVMCTDANGEPVACTNLTDTAFSGYVPTSRFSFAGTNNVLTYTGDFSLGLTLTGNTSVTLPESGTLATTALKPSDLAIADQAAGDLLYFNGTNWVRFPKGTANQLLGMKSDASIPEYKSTINATLDDSAAQFKSATAGHVGLLKILLSGSTTDKTMTIASNQTDDRTVTLPDATGTIALVKAEKLAVFNWDGGGSAVVAAAGTKRCVMIPAASTLTGVYLFGDASTTSTISLHKDAFATDSLATTAMISGTNAVTLTTAIGMNDTTLTNYTTAISAGDQICAIVTANDNAKWLQLVLYGTK